MRIPRDILRRYQQVIAGRGEVRAETIEVMPYPARTFEREQEMIEEINALISKQRRTAMPAELRAEIKALTTMATEAIELHNRWIEQVESEQAVLSSKGLNALLRLERHIDDMTKRITKKSAYLQEKSPELPPLKPLPFLILRRRRLF